MVIHLNIFSCRKLPLKIALTKSKLKQECYQDSNRLNFKEINLVPFRRRLLFASLFSDQFVRKSIVL